MLDESATIILRTRTFTSNYQITFKLGQTLSSAAFFGLLDWMLMIIYDWSVLRSKWVAIYKRKNEKRNMAIIATNVWRILYAGIQNFLP